MVNGQNTSENTLLKHKLHPSEGQMHDNYMNNNNIVTMNDYIY